MSDRDESSRPLKANSYSTSMTKKTQVLARIAHLERQLSQDHSQGHHDEESGRGRSPNKSHHGHLDSEGDDDDDDGRECMASKFLAIALTILLSGFIYLFLVQEYFLRASRQ